MSAGESASENPLPPPREADVTAGPSAPRAGATPQVVVGVDLVERGRLALSYARLGDRLLQRLFTPAEIAEASGQVARLEGRFAAKEACAKALGVGIGRYASWQDIEILRLPGGKPALTIRGAALARAQALGLVTFDVSISDTSGHVIAVVVGAGPSSA